MKSDKRVFEAMKIIIAHYECPPECKAKCCKLGRIYLYKGERKNMKRNGVALPKMGFDSKSRNWYMLNPCGLLTKEDRCSIHDISPVVCKMYPFVFHDGITPEGAATLVMCPVGYNIYIDLINMIQDEGFDELRYRALGNAKRIYEEFLQDINGLGNMSVTYENIMAYAGVLISKDNLRNMGLIK